jgi:hypothetical protein
MGISPNNLKFFTTFTLFILCFFTVFSQSSRFSEKTANIIRNAVNKNFISYKVAKRLSCLPYNEEYSILYSNDNIFTSEEVMYDDRYLQHIKLEKKDNRFYDTAYTIVLCLRESELYNGSIATLKYLKGSNLQNFVSPQKKQLELSDNPYTLIAIDTLEMKILFLSGNCILSPFYENFVKGKYFNPLVEAKGEYLQLKFGALLPSKILFEKEIADWYVYEIYSNIWDGSITNHGGFPANYVFYGYVNKTNPDFTKVFIK